MTRITLTGLALVLSAGLASAADLPSRKGLPPLPESIPTFTWTGFYVGGQAGYNWGRDWTKEFLTATGEYTGMQWRYPVHSALGGIYAGANYQFGAVVVGVEGDAALLNGRGGFDDPGGRGRVRQNWEAAVRARLGYSFGTTLLYAAGGAAFSQFKYVYTNPLGASEGTNPNRVGWTVGGGVEQAFTPNLVGRVEYRYTDWGDFKYTATSAFLGLTGRQSPRANEVRAGLGYKF